MKLCSSLHTVNCGTVLVPTAALLGEKQEWIGGHLLQNKLIKY